MNPSAATRNVLKHVAGASSTRFNGFCVPAAGFNPRSLRAHGVHFGEADLIVELLDGRTVTVPLAWFPRLFHGTAAERAHWRWVGGGGIHWPDLDEDISIEGIILGRPSGESQESLRRWLEQRPLGEKR
jgi:hypothetical protein